MAYVCLLPIFAVVYYRLYTQNPDNFSFASSIAETRFMEIDSQLHAAVDELALREAALRQLIVSLENKPYFSEGTTTIDTPQFVFTISSNSRSDFGVDGYSAGVSYLVRIYGKTGQPRGELLDTLSAFGPIPADGKYDARIPKLYRAMAWSTMKVITEERTRRQRELQRPRSVRHDQWSMLDFAYFSVITQALSGTATSFQTLGRLAWL